MSYEAGSGRWRLWATADPGLGTAAAMLAESDAGDPGGEWTVYSINLPADAGHWPDVLAAGETTVAVGLFKVREFATCQLYDDDSEAVETIAVPLDPDRTEKTPTPARTAIGYAGRFPTLVDLSGGTAWGNSIQASAVFSDLDGVGDVVVAQVLIAGTLDGRNACLLAYFPGNRQLALLNDSGSAFQFALEGSTAILENSQCMIDVRATNVERRYFPPTDFWIFLAGVTLKPSFSDTKII